jgi:hypothetical protein
MLTICAPESRPTGDLAKAEFAARPWTLAERDKPASGTLTQQLRFVLGYALLAPSSHNSLQPASFLPVDR